MNVVPFCGLLSLKRSLLGQCHVSSFWELTTPHHNSNSCVGCNGQPINLSKHPSPKGNHQSVTPWCSPIQEWLRDGPVQFQVCGAWTFDWLGKSRRLQCVHELKVAIFMQFETKLEGKGHQMPGRLIPDWALQCSWSWGWWQNAYYCSLGRRRPISTTLEPTNKFGTQQPISERGKRGVYVHTLVIRPKIVSVSKNGT